LSTITDIPTFKKKFKRSVAASLNSDYVNEHNINITSIDEVRRRSLLATGLSVEYLIIANHITYSTLHTAVSSTLNSTSFVSTVNLYTGYSFVAISKPTIVNLSPTAAPTMAPTTKSSASASLSAGAIVGIVIGGLVGLILVGATVYYFVFRGGSVGQAKIEVGHTGDAYKA
jgi:hypothetical protein